MIKKVCNFMVWWFFQCRWFACCLWINNSQNLVFWNRIKFRPLLNTKKLSFHEKMYFFWASCFPALHLPEIFFWKLGAKWLWEQPWKLKSQFRGEKSLFSSRFHLNVNRKWNEMNFFSISVAKKGQVFHYTVPTALQGSLFILCTSK